MAGLASIDRDFRERRAAPQVVRPICRSSAEDPYPKSEGREENSYHLAEIDFRKVATILSILVSESPGVIYFCSDVSYVSVHVCQ